MKYSVVVPVYNNSATLDEVVSRLVALREALDGDLEGVFVVDGSPDHSLAVLKLALARKPLSAQLLVHSRNFGSFAAVRTGLAAANGEYIAVMAADLQEPMDLIRQFFGELAKGDCDVAVGRRTARSDPGLSVAGSRLFWWSYRRWVNAQIPPGGVDVFGCTREVAAVLVDMTESHSSMVGQLYWIGYRRSYVDYQRLPRETGESGWTFRKKFRYLLDSIYAFTDLPIALLLSVGVAGILVSLTLGTVVLIAWLNGMISAPGYTTLILVLLGSTSSILLGLGVVGSYTWRAYENTKSRPYAIVRERLEYARGQ